MPSPNTAPESRALTTSTSQVLYEPIESVERMEFYQEGGYHPVKIGDHFHNCYRVVHKLGHGTYSTIWLAQDETCKRYVAVKICTADSDPLEIDIVSQLSEPLKPNGTHAFLVTGPAWMSLSDAKKESWIGLFQLDVARALAAQLVTVIRPPEAQFEPTTPLTFSSDIWTLACTIWDILAQRSLFEGFLTNEDDMTPQQIAALGPLSTEWEEKWEDNNRATSQYASLEDAFELNVQQPRS